MVAVIQRVSESSVKVDGKIIGKISKGLNILLGVKKGDSVEDIDKLVNKIINLRIFQDENDKMNLSLLDVKGEALIISQFTLAGNCKKGRRPSFDSSESPEIAKEYYEMFTQKISEAGVYTQNGRFGAMMDVYIRNDGPVTFVLDSREL
jgi:D-tyrosyl-tRNA(Tyr) deacylase